MKIYEYITAVSNLAQINDTVGDLYKQLGKRLIGSRPENIKHEIFLQSSVTEQDLINLRTPFVLVLETLQNGQPEFLDNYMLLINEAYTEIKRKTNPQTIDNKDMNTQTEGTENDNEQPNYE